MNTRPLVPAERMADRFDQAYTLNFTTVARVRGPLLADRLERALRCLEQRHPLRRARVERGSLGVLRFRRSAAPESVVRCVAGGAAAEPAAHSTCRSRFCRLCGGGGSIEFTGLSLGVPGSHDRVLELEQPRPGIWFLPFASWLP